MKLFDNSGRRKISSRIGFEIPLDVQTHADHWIKRDANDATEAASNEELLAVPIPLIPHNG